MADSPLEQLLLEMGIDLSPVQKAGAQIKSLLQDLNVEADRNVNKTKEQTAAQSASLSQMKALAEEAVQAALQSISYNKEKQASLERQTAEYSKQTAGTEVLSAGVRKLMVDEQAIEAHLKAQTAEIQKQIAERRKEQQESGGEKISDTRRATAGVVSKVGGALFGGSFGALAGAVVGGELIARGIEQATEGLVRFIEKLKEVSIESGKLAQIEDRFDKLAEGVGVNGTKFLDQLSKATEGLVDRFTLAQFGSRALQSGIKGLTPDKITEVTEAVVKLAESSGHTATEGVEKLGMALYRGGARAGAMLAQVTGLTRQQLQLANLSPLMNRTERDVASVTHAFAVLISEANKLGEVPKTLDQAFTQVHVVTKDLLFSFGRGFNEAGGTQIFLEMVAKLTRSLDELSGKAEQIGRSLGNALVAAVPVLTIIQQALTLIWQQVVEIVKEFGRISGATDKNEVVSGIRAIGNAIIFLKPLVDGLVASFGLIAKSALGAFEVISPAFGAADGYRGIRQLPQAWKEFYGAAQSSRVQQDDLYASFNSAMDRVSKDTSTHRAPIRPSSPEGDNTKEKTALLAADRSFEEALLKQRKSYDALDLQEKQEAIAEAKRLDDAAYRSGEETLEQHLAKQKRLAFLSLQAQRDAVNADLTAKQRELEARGTQVDEELKLKRIFPSVGADKKAALAVDLETAINEAAKKGEAAWAKYQSTIDQIDKQGEGERFATIKKAITDQLATTEEGVKAQEALNKQYLDSGRITADQYVASQIAAIEQVALARKQASEETLAAARANSKLTPQLVQEEQDAVVKAVQQAREKLTSLEQQVTQLRLGDITKSFEPGNKGLSTQIGIQQSQPSASFGTSTAALIQRLQQNLQSEMGRLVALANTPAAQANPDTWFKIYEQIQNITQEQLKWNQALKEQLDMARQVGTGLEAIGTSIGQNFQSKFAQSLAHNVQAGAKSLQESFKLADTIRGTAVSPDQKIQQTADKMAAAGNTVVRSYSDQVSAIQRVIGGLDKLAQKASDTAGTLTGSGEAGAEGSNSPVGTSEGPGQGSGEGSGSAASPGSTIQSFSTKMVAAITAVDNFTNSILHSKNALTGAAGGVTGGAGLGNTVSSAFGMAGPLGMLVGAGVGGLLGAITGSKNAQVTGSITGFEDQYKQIMNQFALNTNNLNNTITTLQVLVNQIAQMQASSKKGSSQYQQLIDQYNQQIMQLEQQQNQVIINLKEMAAISSAPLGQQSALGGIQSILQQYEQYAGAIQSVNQLMQQGQTYQQATTNVTNQQTAAYTYLVGAIQAYEQNLQNQLNQDEQQAIQTAIQLNDLLYQRQQMMLQYHNQVESVLSAGVLTRQLTRAQSAGQQIEQITVQYNMQMEALNEQISADQYSVSIASQIFGLATTRIGLENQLLAAQNYQTQQSMSQIAALQALVTQIQSGNFQSGALGTLLGAIPGVTNGANTLTPLQILQIFAGLISSNPGGFASALGGNSTGASAADAAFAAAYDSRASLGFAQFRGANL